MRDIKLEQKLNDIIKGYLFIHILNVTCHVIIKVININSLLSINSFTVKNFT